MATQTSQINSFTDNLLLKVEEAREATEAKLFKEWKNASGTEERELIFAKQSALRGITTELIKNIRGDQ